MRRLFWLGMGVLFLASFFWLSHVYAHLAVAFVLAYLLEPLVTKLEKHGVPRALADVLVLLGFFAALLGFVVIAAPLLVEQGRELVQRTPALLRAVQGFLERQLSTDLAKNIAQIAGVDLSQQLAPQVADTAVASGAASPMLGVLFRSTVATVGVLTSVLGLFVIPLMAFHLMRDFPKLSKRLQRLLPRSYHAAYQELMNRLNLVLGGFLRGQLLVASVLAAFYSIAFLCLRVDLGFVLGVLSGYLTMIPYLGIFTMILLTFLIAILHGASTGKMIGIGVIYLCGVLGEGGFLTPTIVGGRVGLSPLTVLIALMSGAEMLGIRGMLIAIPVAAAVKVVVEYNLEKRSN